VTALQTKTVAVIATLDTKGAEAHFVANIIRERGHCTLMIDVGVLDPAGPSAADISNSEVAREGGAELATLRRNGDKARAMTVMTAGAAVVAGRLYNAQQFDGIIGLGGGAGFATQRLMAGCVFKEIFHAAPGPYPISPADGRAGRREKSGKSCCVVLTAMRREFCPASFLTAPGTPRPCIPYLNCQAFQICLNAVLERPERACKPQIGVRRLFVGDRREVSGGCYTLRCLSECSCCQRG
jgi:hypothetical protein